jgi:hypothetical protein
MNLAKLASIFLPILAISLWGESDPRSRPEAQHHGRISLHRALSWCVKRASRPKSAAISISAGHRHHDQHIQPRHAVAMCQTRVKAQKNML